MKRVSLILLNLLFVIFSYQIVYADNISVLTAGRDYYLIKTCSFEFEHNFAYISDSYDAIRESTRVEDVQDHLFVNGVSTYYGLSDFLNFNLNIPYVYKYHEVGSLDTIKVNDFGDISFGLQWKIFEDSKAEQSLILKGALICPTGKSPYEIKPGEELSTGSGFYSVVHKLSAFKSIASFSIFGDVTYIYNFDVNVDQKRPEGVLDKVETGNRIGFNTGIVYSLTENTAFCLEYPYVYYQTTKYHYLNAPSVESGSGSSDKILYIGVGWKFFQKNSIILKTGIPLSGDGPDFQLNGRFSFRTPSFCL